MADVNISESGVFWDSKNLKVVDSQPEEGVQIVAPGTEVTANAEAEIARWREVESGAPSEPETVTTESVSTSSKKKG